jgi:hypothetical protein
MIVLTQIEQVWTIVGRRFAVLTRTYRPNGLHHTSSYGQFRTWAEASQYTKGAHEIVVSIVQAGEKLKALHA